MGGVIIKTIIVIALLFSYSAQAFDMGLGTYYLWLDVRRGANENAGFFSVPQPFLSISHRWPISGNHSFAPELGYVFMQRNTGDKYGDSKKTTLFLLYNLAWAAAPKFFLHYGLGTFRTTIKGSGGAVTVPNGTSYSTAFKPDGENHSYNTTLNFGFEFTSDKNSSGNAFGGKFETFVFSPIDEKKRSLAYSLSMRYYF